MANDEVLTVLQYSPFNSLVDPSFWHKLSQIKLDIDKLDETARSIFGFYSNSGPSNLTTTLQVDCSAFNSDFNAPRPMLASHGILLNKNTIETFKSCDKVELLKEYGSQLWQHIVNGEAFDDPSLLSRFILLTYGDLKKYHFYYWFAFPTPNFDIVVDIVSPVKKLVDIFTPHQIESLTKSYLDVSNWKQQGFFVCRMNGDSIQVLPLNEIKSPREGNELFIGFSDPCSMDDHPGWPLRNLLVLLSHQCLYLVGRCVKVICLRLHVTTSSEWTCANSLQFDITLPSIESSLPATEMKWVGWERNDRRKFGPRMSNLSSSMDPIKLAEASVDLNLKLMKWRLMPDLDLDVIKETKCLLLGSGTLGCTVARNLLAWGVRKITFVDNGRVSYSNPVRQSLYTHALCAQGGELKATSAAQALKDIFPGVESQGIVLNIPMPGHPIGDSLMAETLTNVTTLEELIVNHDVVFLLMDSRESRWLPTMIAASKGKIVMNAALGFDTYLVMRHGVRHSVQTEAPPTLSKLITGDQLGCYFCNDVTAPGNSQRDRSLDQQCTVTRPGVSGIAGALVVELLVSLLQHPLSAGAAADCEQGSVLGSVPHSIRGFLSQFQQVMPSCQRFDSCIACSQKVLSEYEGKGFDFLLQVFNTPNYLEDITGLTQMKADTNPDEIWELSDSDNELED